MHQKEETNTQPEKNEETRIRKNEERLRNLQDILKYSNIRIIGVPEGEEEEQKIENLFEQIMKEQSRRDHNTWYQTVLQGYGNQNSL